MSDKNASENVNTLIDVTNDPVDFNIGKEVFKVQKISYNQIFRVLEPIIIKEHKDNIKEFSTLFAGQEKINYINQEMRKIPSGEEMIQKIVEKMQTIDGLKHILFIALRKLNKITMEKIEQLFNDNDLDNDIGVIISYALDKAEDKELKPEDTKVNPEAKTEEVTEVKTDANPL